MTSDSAAHLPKPLYQKTILNNTQDLYSCTKVGFESHSLPIEPSKIESNILKLDLMDIPYMRAKVQWLKRNISTGADQGGKIGPSRISARLLSDYLPRLN